MLDICFQYTSAVQHMPRSPSAFVLESDRHVNQLRLKLSINWQLRKLNRRDLPGPGYRMFQRAALDCMRLFTFADAEKEMQIDHLLL